MISTEGLLFVRILEGIFMVEIGADYYLAKPSENGKI